MIDTNFLSQGIRHSPHQPATCLFRAVELGHLVEQKLLPLEGRVLDLGCGDGWILSMLKERLQATWKLAGLDPDEREVQLAAKTGLYAELKVAPGDCIPFQDSSFDLVFSNSVLEHIPDVRPVLAEAARKLSKGGHFVFTVPCSQFPQMLRFPSLLGRFVSRADSREAYLAYMDRRLAHRYYWDLDTWSEELRKVGLHVQRHYFYLAQPELARWETLSHLTAGLVGRLSSSQKHPLELQHQLGIRNGQASLPISLLGRLLGIFGRLGLNRKIPVHATQGSCLALSARKS